MDGRKEDPEGWGTYTSSLRFPSAEGTSMGSGCLHTWAQPPSSVYEGVGERNRGIHTLS